MVTTPNSIFKLFIP